VSSSENMSKRERQKQRRDAKLQQQRAAQAKSRRARLLTFAVLGVILAGLIGAFVYNKAEENRLAEERKAAVQAKLDDLGCTETEKLEDQGAGHFSNEELAATPPDVAFPDRPATSGKHFGNWLMTGVYDQRLDERALVHNLEHGYILGYFDEGADEAQVEALKTYAQELIDDKLPKIIVSRWDGDLPDDANFAYVAWNNRQLCKEFDEEVFLTFAEDFHSSNGDAPPAEKGISPHLEEGNGTIDPGTEDFLLPPLGSQAVPSEGMDSGASESTS
jgi:hypothetical protein